MSPANASPPPSVKHLLKRLSYETNPTGARTLLIKMNHNTDSSASSSPSLKSFSAQTPWPDDVMKAAYAFSNELQLRRKELATSFAGKSGKRGPSGRMDYRSAAEENPPICIDSSKASFYDDAFSLSPETGELLVHIVDVNEYMRRYPLLQKVAQERLASAFLPTGPVHMLPPVALDGVKLSSELPNEVITVALSINDVTGELIGFRVFPSVIGPVVPISQEFADDVILRMQRKEEAAEEGSSAVEAVQKLGISDTVVQDLFRASKIVDKMIEKQPWVDETFLSGKAIKYSLDRRSGLYKQQEPSKTTSTRMINALLSAYSNASCEYCIAKNVSVPIAWENRDKIDSSRISRYGTRPLRSWLAQLQQKQLRAALKLELPLTRKECALAVTYHSTNKKQLSAFERKGREIMSFESLESHCSAMAASGQSECIHHISIYLFV
jgi:RNB domain